MTRLPLPSVLFHRRGSPFRGNESARDILARDWRRTQRQRARWRAASAESASPMAAVVAA